VAPPAPPAPPSDAASRAELEALKRDVETLRGQLSELSVARAESETFERRLDFYGFADMGLQRVWSRRGAATSGTGSPRALTFVFGNVNFYADANPVSGWRALTEFRFTNYPHENRTAATVFDVNSPDPGWNEVSLGALVLEQAWIQGTASDLFAVRVGYFLTPFGIWNIDHGTPTVVGLTRPQFTRGRFYPDHQLGAQLLGQLNHDSWSFGYVAYASNGKTQGALDVTDDKAFGGRLSASTTRPFHLSFGIAGYTGRYSGGVTVPDGLGKSYREDVAYRQWDGGADVSLDVGSFRLRAEAAVERVEYDPGKHEPVFGIAGTAWPNRTLWGAYLLGAYQLPWWGLEPYVSGELYRYPTPLSEAAMIPGAGLNVHVSPEVQVKTQFAKAHFFDLDGQGHEEHDTSTLAARLVLAF
jgi:hypothetical protein